MDRIINIKVGGNYLTKDNKTAGVRGEGNVTYLRITFDSGWDGFAKTVTFWDAQGQNPVKRTLTVDMIEDIDADARTYLVPIPAEPMALAGTLTFVIDGYTDGKRQRSISDKLEVKDAPITDNAQEPADPTPTQAEQLQEQIDGVLENIQRTFVAVEQAEKQVQLASAELQCVREEMQLVEELVEQAGEAQKFAEQAENALGKTNYIGYNGNWFAWDSKINDFYDTGVKAQSGSTVYVGDNPPEDADIWLDTTFEDPAGYVTEADMKAALSEIADKDLTNVTDKGLQNITSKEFAVGEIREVLPSQLKAGDVIVDFKADYLANIDPNTGEETWIALTKDDVDSFGLAFDGGDAYTDIVTSLDNPYTVGDKPFAVGDITYNGIAYPSSVSRLIVCDGTDKIATKKDTEELLETLLEYSNKVAPSPASITIYADKWEQDENGLVWYQEVQVNNANITPYSKVDLQLSAEQVAIFYEKDLAFVTENEGGVVTVYCIGSLPQNTYTMQATVSEVAVGG